MGPLALTRRPNFVQGNKSFLGHLLSRVDLTGQRRRSRYFDIGSRLVFTEVLTTTSCGVHNPSCHVLTPQYV
jgi:hypothetical protein